MGDSAPRSLHEGKNMPKLELLSGRNPVLLFLSRPEQGTESSLSSGHLDKRGLTSRRPSYPRFLSLVYGESRKDVEQPQKQMSNPL
ncbi:hypothetical protein Q7C36_008056 [Tachysurus vachellii]|uniref:Uncharacterized protein n=1 Tax=Tachysurus vachellii TaxID=175792 RepID=A0AA88SXX5_TACVA|nr:hypothetical protein Q7C36_008056 [Tachysurus vachellii]